MMKMSRTSLKWQENSHKSISRESMDLLMSNKIPAIRIPDFASQEECSALLNAIRSFPIDYYEGVYPPIARLGISQFECQSEGKAKYFESVPRSEKWRKHAASESFDAVTRMCNMLKTETLYPTDFAYEAKYGRYFAGIVRHINNSALLHVDVSCNDAQGWSIESIDSQIAWNLYLDVPEIGGDCLVYNRQWSIEDEKSKIYASYGYDAALVQDAECYRFKPKRGEVVLFNCRNFHQVLPSEGSRVSIGSFIGRTMGGSLILWS